MSTEMVNLKIILQQTTIQLRVTQKKAAEIAKSLRSSATWIDLPLANKQTLCLKSQSIAGYEFLSMAVDGSVKEGLMRINALAEMFGIHPVSVSRLIAKGKLPAVSTEGKKRKHSQANLETALALRDWMKNQGRDTLSEEKIKKAFL